MLDSTLRSVTAARGCSCGIETTGTLLAETSNSTGFIGQLLFSASRRGVPGGAARSCRVANSAILAADDWDCQ